MCVRYFLLWSYTRRSRVQLIEPFNLERDGSASLTAYKKSCMRCAKRSFHFKNKLISRQKHTFYFYLFNAVKHGTLRKVHHHGRVRELTEAGFIALKNVKILITFC